MNHLSEKQISGYIHQTLTDAKRESIDQHLQSCNRCRQKLADAQQLQRDVHYGLRDVLKGERATQVRFSNIADDLNKNRRRTVWTHRSWQVVTQVALVTLLLVSIVFINDFVKSPEFVTRSSPADLTTDTSFMGIDWLDPAPYESNLIASEQMVLTELANRPIYHIDLTIDENMYELKGEQEVRFVNHTNEALKVLYFQLLSPRSGTQMMLEDVRVNGRSTIASLELNDEILRVQLPRALEPAEAVTVQMSFSLQMGRNRENYDGTLGWIEQVLTLSQFHPTLVTIRDGEWQRQTNPNGYDLSTTPSFYQVRVTLPANIPIIASGTEISRERLNSQQQVVTFVAGPISQFYLTASERFSMSVSQMVGQTRVTSYTYSDYLGHEAQTALDEVINALTTYNEQLGEYPFTELVVVGAPTLSFSTPQRAFSGIILLAPVRPAYLQDEGEAITDDLTAVRTAVAYQWMGHINGGNALHEPWLTEGLTTYIAMMPVTEAETAVLQEILYDQPNLPIGLSTHSYTPSSRAQTLQIRAPYALAHLQQTMGDRVFEAFLRDYIRLYRWGSNNGQIASRLAFQELAEDHCHCELDDFFRMWVDLQR